MQTYLRFTPQEFQAISQACRPLDLVGGVSLPAFQRFVAEALRGTRPALADRIARFRKYQVGILYEHLKEQRASGAGPAGRAAEAKGPAGCDLTAEEWRALSQAGELFRLQGGPPSSFKGFVLQQLGAASPALAQKLARLSDYQIAKLYHQARARRGA